MNTKVESSNDVKAVNVNEALKSAGLTVLKTDQQTMLDQLGASVGYNSCSTVLKLGN